jgi:DMSO/TMAO reductase YedYZ molybdopterin-dependent catalytic subunit
MPRREIEGDWILGWPDRKRPHLMEGKDGKGRVIFGRSPLRDLEGLITPVDSYYIVAQLQMPEPVHPDDWTLTIGGEVDRPFEVTFEELRKLPGRTVRAVTECAGNDADYFNYLRDGGRKPSLANKQDMQKLAQMMQAGEKPSIEELGEMIPSTGYLSAGEFTGVPLAEVLKKAGLKPNAVCVRFEGFDRGRPDPTVQYLSAGRTDIPIVDPGVINYDKAMPLVKALHPDTLLAWAQNGEYLQHVHGAPVRLVTPGWSGNWWVKWLQKIEVMDHLPDCYYQTQYFVFADTPESPERQMCTALGVKSHIIDPLEEDSPLVRGSHAIRGLAWSGAGMITRVEVSVDAGQTWHDAHIEEPGEKWLWRRWSYLWEVNKAGSYKLMARATDEEGRRQPQIKFNYQRKHFDGIVPVEVVVE